MSAEPIIVPLYGGEITVKFFPDSHQYWVKRPDEEKAKRKSGVTTYLGIKDKSRALQSWQQQITADFLLSRIADGVKINTDLALEAVVQNEVQRDAAADIGHEIHGWCEAYIKNKLKLPGYETMPDIPKFPEAVTGVDSFLEWQKKHKAKFISSEKIVYSKKHDFVGIMDFEAVIDGVHCAGDFKSSNGLYNGVRAQVAAYAEAFNEERGKRAIKGRWAVRLSKYTEEEYYKREERKKELKKAIARIQGKPYKEYPAKPYQVFEAKFLDDHHQNMQRDFSAFLNAKALFEWDKLTDPFYAGENW